MSNVRGKIIVKKKLRIAYKTKLWNDKKKSYRPREFRGNNVNKNNGSKNNDLKNN